VIEAVAGPDRVAQGQVVRADDIRPLQRDEQRALHGPRADPLDLREPLITSWSGSSPSSASDRRPSLKRWASSRTVAALRQDSPRPRKRPGVEGRQLARTRHPAAELPGQPGENSGRRDHRDLLSDDLEDQRTEQAHGRQPAHPHVGVEIRPLVDQLGQHRIGRTQPAEPGANLLRALPSRSPALLIPAGHGKTEAGWARMGPWICT
jgi:hypothetical protein